jgi:hypothetical protein
MTYAEVKQLKPEEFKRLCGVNPSTFNEMVVVLQAHERSKKKSGRPSKLIIEDQLLLTLQYWREYRTYFHISKSWHISESNTCRIVRKVEDVLINSGLFALPGKKELRPAEYQIEVVVVDVTETPVERPKKSSANATQVRRNDIH